MLKNFFKKLFGQRRDAFMGPETHDWRTLIAQDVKPTLGDNLARKRVVRSRLPLVLALGFFLVLGLVIWVSIDESTTETRSSTLRFKTDGFLTQKYVQKIIEANPQGTAREVRAIQADLEADNQVQNASVRRRADGSLDVVLRERIAVARVAVNPASTSPMVIRLVAPDGVTFAGTNYPEQAIRNLPEIQDFRSTGSGDAMVIDGLEIAGALLLAARTQYPNYYKQWMAVSMRDCFGVQEDTSGSSLRVMLRPGMQPMDRPALVEIDFSTGNWRAELLLLTRLDLEGLLRRPAATAPAYVLKLSIQNRTTAQPIPEPRLVPYTSR